MQQRSKILDFRVFILIVILSLSHSVAKADLGLIFRKIVHTNNAFFDLSHQDFDKAVYALYGKWEFYWHQLLTPEQIAKGQAKPILVEVPNNWTNYQVNGQNLPSFGYATYHIRVKIPKGLSSISLSVHGIFTAYRLYVNGKFIDENGKVATNKVSHKGTWVPKTYVIYPQGDTLDIVFQVSNFVHFKAGLLRQIVIGQPQQMYRYAMLGIAYEAGLIGTMLIMALYFLFFFYYQPTNISSLYLSLVLVGQAILTSLDGEYIMFRFFPNLNFKFAVHLLYLMFFYRSVLFLHYLYHLVPKELNIKFVTAITAVYFLMGIYVLVFPISKFSFALNFYIFATLFLGVLIIVWLIRLIKYQIGAVYALIGLVLVLITGVNDALYDYGIIHTFYMLGLGFSVFVFVLSIMIALHNARTHAQAMGYWLMLKKLDNLREQLIKIPFYDLGGVLYLITTTINSSRGLWIDRNKDKWFVSYEHTAGHTVEVNKSISELPQDYMSKLSFYIALKYRRFFSFSLSRKAKRRSRRKRYKFLAQIVSYLMKREMMALAVKPIISKQQLRSMLYFENRYSHFSTLQKKLLDSVNPQLAALRQNADSYRQLQEINRKLEQLVRERTEVLKRQEQELQQKEAELKEKVEELRAYNEEINRIHQQLEKHKYEIEMRNFELEKLHNEIYQQKLLAEQRNKMLTEEIEFAKSIQQLILRLEPSLPFSDLFILYLPKQIVSGDFYWIRRFGKKIVIAVADCTGHGVPGAFMSVLGATFLNEILSRYYIEDPQFNIDTADILEELRDMVIRSLGQDENDASAQAIKDGMDIALLIFDEETMEAKFSGAYLSLILIRENQLIEYKGDRQPIGVYYKPSVRRQFTTYKFKLLKGDAFYMFTDGYSDQFNPNGEKFYKKNLKKVLLKISGYPGSIQRDLLEKIFKEWKGDHYQVDDILILGVTV